MYRHVYEVWKSRYIARYGGDAAEQSERQQEQHRKGIFFTMESLQTTPLVLTVIRLYIHVKENLVHIMGIQSNVK